MSSDFQCFGNCVNFLELAKLFPDSGRESGSCLDSPQLSALLTVHPPSHSYLSSASLGGASPEVCTQGQVPFLRRVIPTFSLGAPTAWVSYGLLCTKLSWLLIYCVITAPQDTVLPDFLTPSCGLVMNSHPWNESRGDTCHFRTF